MLSGRLLTVYNKIPYCNIVCDIGTDHGYIPVELIINNRCKRVIGADIVKGPLKAAEKNARRFSVLDKIELRQGDGLDPIDINEIDVVIIAGMGGGLIGKIISKGFEKGKEAKLLILQPMNAVDDLRSYLYNSGFDIVDEELSSEGEKIYNIIVARYDGIARNKTPFLIYIGEMLLNKNKRTPLFERYIAKRLRILNDTLVGIKKSNNYYEEEGNKIKGLIDEVEGLL